MAISIAFELSGVTVGASELSIVSGNTSLQSNTDDGVYQLWVDGSNMAKGDEFIIKIKEKVRASGGTQRTVFSAILSDSQSEAFVTPTLILMNGWDMTIQRTAGSDRSFDASIRKVA